MQGVDPNLPMPPPAPVNPQLQQMQELLDTLHAQNQDLHARLAAVTERMAIAEEANAQQQAVIADLQSRPSAGGSISGIVGTE